ncbi:cupredoxin domain-containing protein [Geodermatophilus sp. URMC 64]
MRLHGKLLIGAVVALTVLGVSGVAQAGGGGGDRDREVVKVKDDCDPETFNAAIGPGTCVGNGDTTFQEFIRQLGRLNEAPEWRFSPRYLRIDEGDVLVAKNVGGEEHTFTPVDHFGGGCVPPVEEALRDPEPTVPECDDEELLADTTIPAGGRLVFDDLGRGKHLFECLLHPWMRSVVVVRGDHHHHDHGGHHH